jgi:hypothetical protein
MFEIAVKILHVTSSYHPAYNMGGAVAADYSVDATLASMDVSVDVLTTNVGLKSQDIPLHEWVPLAGREFKH